MEQPRYAAAVDAYGNTVYRIACSYCKCRADAEDVVQNVFLKLLQTDTEFQDEKHLKRWLIRVAANEAKNLCGSFWKKHMVPLEDSETIQPFEFRSQKNSELYEAVLQLPHRYRIVIHLYYYEDYSVREIAGILHLRETTVQTQLMRGREKLKEILKEDWQHES